MCHFQNSELIDRLELTLLKIKCPFFSLLDDVTSTHCVTKVNKYIKTEVCTLHT